ncbi:MAG: ABC transporter substrate-binding protein [Planctomycetota bacterium]|jgi:iron complex transport system substrate-binding protein
MHKTVKHLLYLLFFLLAAVCILLMLSGNGKKKEFFVDPLPSQPERIVSLAPNITEILFALGLEDKIIAVSGDSDFPVEAENKEKVGTFWQPNTESILAMKPDLVVTLSFEQQKSVAESLGRLGYPVLTLEIKRMEHLFTAIEKIGNATNHSPDAVKLINDIKDELHDCKLSIKNERAKVLWVIQSEPLRVAGRKTFLNEMIELAGGENAIGPTVQQYPAIGTEELFACGAEVIIHSAMGKNNIDEQQLAAERFWSRISNLPAVKNERIYVLDSDTILRLGPRIAEGVSQIIYLLSQDIQRKEKNSG